MEGYDFLKQLGKGAEGTVWKAVHKATGRVCAIKQINGSFSTYEDCWNIREVQVLQKLHPHPNIVALQDVILEGSTLFLVLEFMECDLLELFRNGRVDAFSEHEVRNLCFQILRGLVRMHTQGYCHRDLKPENLLVTGDIVKIADFGHAVNLQHDQLQPYVGTHLYRAPEVLLGCADNYDFAVDIWALGVITAEFFCGYSLFTRSEMEYLMRDICSLIGSPDSRTWHQGLALAASMDYRFPEEFMNIDSSKQLSSSLPGVSAVAINFISRLLSWDPKRRPGAIEALQHPFFHLIQKPLRHDSSLPASHSEAIANDGHEQKPCDNVIFSNLQKAELTAKPFLGVRVDQQMPDSDNQEYGNIRPI